jgi:hypothetical protein
MQLRHLPLARRFSLVIIMLRLIDSSDILPRPSAFLAEKGVS